MALADAAWRASEPPLGLLDSHSGSFYQALFRGLTRAKFLEKAFRYLAEVPAVVMVTDRSGIIQCVSERFSMLTGYSHQEVRGQAPRILKSGETPPDRFRDLWRTLLGGREWHGEFHNRKKTGETDWEFSSIWPITNEAGKIEHFLAIKSDITKRKASRWTETRSSQRWLPEITRPAMPGRSHPPC